MKETQCVRIPLRADAAEEFVEFARSLADRRDEVIEVLNEEGMSAEAVFLERTEDQTSIVLFTKADSLEEAHQRYLASEHPIQQKMRELSGRAFDMGSAQVLEVLLDCTGNIARAGRSRNASGSDDP